MQLSLQLVTPPTVEPVTLALAKQQLRVDFPDDDALITAYIKAARQYCEKSTNRAFYNQTWMRSLDYFPLNGSYATSRTPSERQSWPNGVWYWNRVTIDLPKPKTVSVASITYVDSSGATQTLNPATYNVDTSSVPARITPVQGSLWPIMQTYQPGSVKVTYVAGSYGDGVTINTIPQTIVMAILLLVSHWYENRSASSEVAMKSIPMGVDALLSQERVHVPEYR